MSKALPPTDDDGSRDEAPEYRPSDRFWPYVDVPETPTDEELATVDPDLRAVLLGDSAPRPFSVTIVFPEFPGVDCARAVELARDAADYRATGTGASLRHRARFLPGQARELRTLFELVGPMDETEVLVDDRPVPYARELWLPLFWYLLQSRP